MTIQRIHTPGGAYVVETKDDTGKTLDLTSFVSRESSWSAMGLLVNVLIACGHNRVILLPDKEAAQ